MKQLTALVLICALTLTPAHAEETQGGTLPLTAPAYVLMEKSTGTVLLEQDAHTPREPASVTKIMTLLLLMEAIDGGRLQKDTLVTVSANAAGQGGSQVFLKEGEQMTVWVLMKCITVVSANDACVALAEHLCGSVDSFVAKMNERAAALGMVDTHFENCTGLPAEGHLTTPYDIALMSQALIKNHPSLRELTTIWMDTIRDGAFGLSNTNRLIRYYDGATGLKTGHTDTALFCMSATAERDGMELIAVVMGAPSSADRVSDVSAMLDYGFAGYSLTEVYPQTAIPPIPVLLGACGQVQPQPKAPATLLLSKAEAGQVTTDLSLATDLIAPVEAGQTVGTMRILVAGTVRDEIPLIATEDIPRLTTLGIFSQMLAQLFLAN